MHFTNTLLLAGAAAALPFPQGSPEIDATTISVSDFTVQRGPDGTQYSFNIADDNKGIVAASCEALAPPTSYSTSIDSIQDGACTSYDPSTGIPSKEPISTFSWYFSRTSDAGILGIDFENMAGEYDTFTFGRSGSEMYEYVTGPKDFSVELRSVGAPIQKRFTEDDVKITNFNAVRSPDSTSYDFDFCDELNHITAHCSADVPAASDSENNLNSVSDASCTSIDPATGLPAKEPISTGILSWCFAAEENGGVLSFNDNGLDGAYYVANTGRSGSAEYAYINDPAGFTMELTSN